MKGNQFLPVVADVDVARFEPVDIFVYDPSKAEEF